MKPRIYQAHLMEGLKIPDESGVRSYEFQKLVGSEFEYLCPEDWQASVKYDDIEQVDYMKWRSSDIVVADLYHIGQDRKNDIDKPIVGIGTNQEIGWTKVWNRETKNKKKILIVILRKRIAYHPFFKCKDIFVVNSLEEAALFVKEKKWKK